MDIQRRALAGRAVCAMVAWAGGSRVWAQNTSPSAPEPMTTDINCNINGHPISRSQVLDWEWRRLQVVWKKLRPQTSAAESVDAIAQMRQDLLAHKLQLGATRIKSLLASELALSGVVQRLLLSTSFGRYALSVTDIQCNQGSAEGFVQWFAARVNANDEPAMLLASPDHYVIETQDNGQQYVLETTGGSPLATQFDIDYADARGNPVPLLAELPVRVGGMALDAQKAIGYAFHQFGNVPGGGFRGRLSVAFPRSTPRFMIDGHRWHLACEFSNWIEAYLRSTP